MTEELVHLPMANSGWVMGSAVESREVVYSSLQLRGHLYRVYSQAKIATLGTLSKSG